MSSSEIDHVFWYSLVPHLCAHGLKTRCVQAHCHAV